MNKDIIGNRYKQVFPRGKPKIRIFGGDMFEPINCMPSGAVILQGCYPNNVQLKLMAYVAGKNLMVVALHDFFAKPQLGWQLVEGGQIKLQLVDWLP